LVDELTENHKRARKQRSEHKSDPDLLAALTGVRVSDQLNRPIGEWGQIVEDVLEVRRNQDSN